MPLASNQLCTVVPRAAVFREDAGNLLGVCLCVYFYSANTCDFLCYFCDNFATFFHLLIEKKNGLKFA